MVDLLFPFPRSPNFWVAYKGFKEIIKSNLRGLLSSQQINLNFESVVRRDLKREGDLYSPPSSCAALEESRLRVK